MGFQLDTSGEKAFDQFCQRFGADAGQEVMEIIADVSWGHEKRGHGVVITDTHTINACNHIYTGTIEYRGETYGFVIESGDRNGTVIHEWGEPDDIGGFEPPEPVLYTLAPTKPAAEMSPAMLGVYRAWTKEPWFEELVRAYNYDRHFAPGLKTETYYREKAAARGLCLAPTTVAAEYLAPAASKGAA